MPRTHLFDAAEFTAFIRERLRPYLNYGADFVNADAMLGAIVDIVIYGEPVQSRRSPTLQMTDLGIPSQVARETVEELCSQLHMLFNTHIGHINPRYVYEWEIVELTDTLIVREVERLPSPIPPPPTVDVVTNYRLQMQRIIEEGGWVSESVRRNLGL